MPAKLCNEGLLHIYVLFLCYVVRFLHLQLSVSVRLNKAMWGKFDRLEYLDVLHRDCYSVVPFNLPCSLILPPESTCWNLFFCNHSYPDSSLRIALFLHWGPRSGYDYVLLWLSPKQYLNSKTPTLTVDRLVKYFQPLCFPENKI